MRRAPTPPYALRRLRSLAGRTAGPLAVLIAMGATSPFAIGDAGAQAVRRPVAKPAPSRPAAAAPAAPDTGTFDFTVSGVHVILRRNTANDVVAANLYLLGGTRLVPATKAGLEPVLLALSEQGTKRYPKDALREAMARLGTGIGIGADRDWTMFGLRATGGTLDSTWAVFADRLMHPTLDANELELLRGQLLTGVRQRADDPDNYLEFLADSVAYAGHPWGIPPSGTEQSLAALTRDDLVQFQRTQLVTSRMLLVVVGNVTRASIERLVRATIGTLPKGDYAWTVPASPAWTTPSLAVSARRLPTNYLLGYFAGPPASSRDYLATRIAAAVLSGQLFAEIRSRRNLTYAVNAPFEEGGYAAVGLYVSTVAPDTVVSLMQRELQLLQRERVSEDGLRELVNQFVTDYYLDNETNAKQADALARAQLYRGDWRAADRFLTEVREVTPDDIQRVAKQYFRTIRMAYIGDPRRLTRARLLGFN